MKKLLSVLIAVFVSIVVQAANSDVVISNEVGATLSFSSSGPYEWEWDSSEKKLRSTNYNVDSSTSQTSITIETSSSCILSFDYAVSSESGYDKFTITLDGDIANEVSGTVSYTYKFYLRRGSHTLVFNYTKDDTQNENDDRAYVSNMSFLTYVSSAYPSVSYNQVNYKLTVSGTGDMNDYASLSSAPGFSAYNNGYRAQTAVIENGVASIGARTFEKTRSITSVIIPNTVKSINAYAFKDCNNLSSISIPNSVTTIGEGAFKGCSTLSPVTIPNNVTSIGEFSFSDCHFLSITIPESLTYIGQCAFAGCKYLRTITVDVNNPKYDSRDECNAIIETSTNKLHVGCWKTIIPNSVTSIGDNAFYNCNLSSITIPSNVTKIGKGAFAECANLNSVTCLSTTPPSIHSNTFSKYGTLHIPYGSKEAYANTDIWKNFSIIDDIIDPSLPNGECGTNAKWSYNPNTCELVILGTGNMNDYDNTYLSQNPVPWSAFLTNIRKITIFDGITNIGNSAFYGCTEATSVTISNSVKSIGDYAFGECSNIPSITIPNIVTNIGESAFYGCSELTSVAIPNSVKNIDELAFAFCVNLSSVTVPSSVTNIGNSAFAGCNSLSTIEVSSQNTKYDSRDGCNAIIEKSTNTLLQGCKNTTIPNTVTSIGDNAFIECSGLTSIDIPNSVTSIGSTAFAYCPNLTSVVIPNSVRSIGDYAFSSCSALVSVNILCTTPPATGYEIFYDTPIQSATLYVPSGSIEIYQITSPWSIFGDIPYPPTTIELVDATPIFYEEDADYASITYTRIFNNTNWQALYVPFSINYEDWAENFEVARLNNVNQYDDDNNGSVDRTVLEVIKLVEGSKTKPNIPYMIKAKEIGEKTITVTDATLHKTEEISHDVTSWDTRFTFTGTYHTITDMATNGYYALAGGRLQQATNDAVTLSPMRWYLSVADRNGNPQNLAKAIGIVIDCGEATGISEVSTSTASSQAIYSINGSYIGTDRSKLSKGIYVSDGKKIIIK